ncbi:MAG: hypothetical protein LBV04_02590 [Deferribacteraceae bacterium]|jgi:hypothetical protein|nr:hypothetical protein [Deferribacteraceae bacterium]
MKKLTLIIALIFTVACSDSDDSDGGGYRHDFSTGTYELTGVSIDGGTIDTDSTYLMKFSIDRQADRLVLLEATALYAGGALVEREFEYKAEQWDYQYSRWDQDFDSCGEMTGNKITCTERENGRSIAYTITKLNDNFDANLDLLGTAFNGTVATSSNGTYGLVAYDGSSCRVEGELYLNGNTASYDLDLERGCPIVRELEAWDGSVTVGAVDSNDLLSITIDTIPLKFKKFSDKN